MATSLDYAANSARAYTNVHQNYCLNHLDERDYPYPQELERRITSHDVNKGVDNISDQYGDKKNGLKLRLKCAGITVLDRIKLSNVLANATQSRAQ